MTVLRRSRLTLSMYNVCNIPSTHIIKKRVTYYMSDTDVFNSKIAQANNQNNLDHMYKLFESKKDMLMEYCSFQKRYVENWNMNVIFFNNYYTLPRQILTKYLMMDEFKYWLNFYTVMD